MIHGSTAPSAKIARSMPKISAVRSSVPALPGSDMPASTTTGFPPASTSSSVVSRRSNTATIPGVVVDREGVLVVRHGVEDRLRERHDRMTVGFQVFEWNVLKRDMIRCRRKKRREGVHHREPATGDLPWPSDTCELGCEALHQRMLQRPGGILDAFLLAILIAESCIGEGVRGFNDDVSREFAPRFVRDRAIKGEIQAGDRKGCGHFNQCARLTGSGKREHAKAFAGARALHDHRLL